VGPHAVLAAVSDDAAVSAILFDRDGTLIVNVAHNADPGRVEPAPTAAEAVALVRAAGLPMAVVSNQSVVGRGWASLTDVEATNARVEALLGPIGPFLICPHPPDADCSCRKPRPGLLHEAAAALDVETAAMVLIGDMGSDLAAAAAAGCRGVLVPSVETPAEDLAEAAETAPTLLAAVRLLLAERAPA
jgi:D-glycero-D-manno-heptose 1,7-bisphosphate phosphatase